MTPHAPEVDRAGELAAGPAPVEGPPARRPPVPLAVSARERPAEAASVPSPDPVVVPPAPPGPERPERAAVDPEPVVVPPAPPGPERSAVDPEPAVPVAQPAPLVPQAAAPPPPRVGAGEPARSSRSAGPPIGPRRATQPPMPRRGIRRRAVADASPPSLARDGGPIVGARPDHERPARAPVPMALERRAPSPAPAATEIPPIGAPPRAAALSPTALVPTPGFLADGGSAGTTLEPPAAAPPIMAPPFSAMGQAHVAASSLAGPPGPAVAMRQPASPLVPTTMRAAPAPPAPSRAPSPAVAPAASAPVAAGLGVGAVPAPAARLGNEVPVREAAATGQAPPLVLVNTLDTERLVEQVLERLHRQARSDRERLGFNLEEYD
jgi:hypothetical protein